jgi:hypothetical protein
VLAVTGREPDLIDGVEDILVVGHVSVCRCRLPALRSGDIDINNTILPEWALFHLDLYRIK